ncbi:CopG family transcriptional regulator [Candidatus Aminicenantes bacterium AC-334-K16]|jgi:hypothetical protein|nr:CopG family transcriptional regulator [Candidatus Aminicenantes bacterium AC-334-K16]
MTKEFTQIMIPTNIYQKLEKKIKGTEYTSVASYVTKILKDHLEKGGAEQQAFTQEEEEKVKERLKALGYID